MRIAAADSFKSSKGFPLFSGLLLPVTISLAILLSISYSLAAYDRSPAISLEKTRAGTVSERPDSTDKILENLEKLLAELFSIVKNMAQKIKLTTLADNIKARIREKFTGTERTLRTGYVDVNTHLHVRTGPGIENTEIGELYRGSKVEILETKNGWHRIKWHGKTAWVCGRYVSSTPVSGIRETPARDTRGNRSDSTSSDYRNVSGAPGILPVPLRTQFSSANIVNGIDYRRSWCGPTSFAMVLDYFGIHKSTYECAKLVEYTFKERNGTYASGILSGARKCGFNKSILTTGQSMEWLKSQIRAGKPVIVNVDVRWKGHYIVVVGFKGNDVVVNDPGKGDISAVRYTISKEAFWSYWSSKNRTSIVLDR